MYSIYSIYLCVVVMYYIKSLIKLVLNEEFPVGWLSVLCVLE